MPKTDGGVAQPIGCIYFFDEGKKNILMAHIFWILL